MGVSSVPFRLMVNSSKSAINVLLHKTPITVTKEKLLTSRWKKPSRMTTIKRADSTIITWYTRVFMAITEPLLPTSMPSRFI